MSLNNRRFRWAVAQVAHAFSIEQEQLLGRSRMQPVALARQVAMVVLRKRWSLSLPVIAGLFQRDHTTVLHACRWIADHPLVDRLCAFADAANLDDPLPEVSYRSGTGFPQVPNRAEFVHFSYRFEGLR